MKAGILRGFRDAIHNLSLCATFSLSPLGGRGQGEGARVVYPKHSSVTSEISRLRWLKARLSGGKFANRSSLPCLRQEVK